MHHIFLLFIQARVTLKYIFFIDLKGIIQTVQYCARNMNSNIYSSRLVPSFNFVCWVATISLVSYWIFVYTLDEDLCIVDYKKYFESESDEFPVLSICLKNQISEEKLKSQNL